MNVRPPAPLITKTCPCGAEFQVRDTPTERKRVYCQKNCPSFHRAGGLAAAETLRTYNPNIVAHKRREYAAKLADPGACVHHWLLDGLSRGTCQRCGETRDFGWRAAV